MTDRMQQAATATRLAAVVPRYLPRMIPSSVDVAWELSATAILARMAGTLQAILQLRDLERAADETILARSFFDHAVMLAWLGADTGTDRMDRFKRADAIQRLDNDDHCSTFGIRLLTPEMREYFTSIRDALTETKNMPSLRQRAEQVDKDWADQLPELGEPPWISYSGFYASLYRHHSAFEHPSAMGFNVVATDVSGEMTRVTMEEEADEALLGMLSPLMIWSLLIASDRLGWPDEDEVNEAWTGPG